MTKDRNKYINKRKLSMPYSQKKNKPIRNYLYKVGDQAKILKYNSEMLN